MTRKVYTRSDFLRLAKIFVFVAFILVIGVYALIRSLPYSKGPSITVLYPIDGMEISTSTIEILGRVDRVNELYVNGYPISIDEQGNFSMILVTQNGLNLLDIKGKDQFDRTTETLIRYYGKI